MNDEAQIILSMTAGLLALWLIGWSILRYLEPKPKADVSLSILGNEIKPVDGLRFWFLSFESEEKFNEYLQKHPDFEASLTGLQIAFIPGLLLVSASTINGLHDAIGSLWTHPKLQILTVPRASI